MNLTPFPAAPAALDARQRQSLALNHALTRAPRYTSYPTAAQFTEAVDEDDHRGWLAGIPAEAPVSVYVHVPYCRRLCWYCGCNTRVVNGAAPVSAYVGILNREIDLAGEAIGRRLKASAIHLGGGSPDILSPEDLDRLFFALRSTFEVTSTASIAAELDPSQHSLAWVKAAARNGLNRASLGVQDFSDDVQRAINRPQSFAVVAEAVRDLRAAGVESINFDLMYGLPRQGVADVLSTVDQALRLRPDRLAVFGYAHVPWMKPHQKLICASELPGAAERLDQSEAAAERLVLAGYVRIGLDHFALPGDEMARMAADGRLRRNFQGYTTDQAETLVGLGASSISQLPGGLIQALTAVTDWRARIQAGRLPTSRGVAVTAEDRWRGEAIERLMCDGALDLAGLAARHPASAQTIADIWEALRPFETQSLIRREGERLCLTAEGRPLVRAVCSVFDRYFAPDAGRHSVAI